MSDEPPNSSIFISYASADRLIVVPLVRRLQQAKHVTWFDRENIEGGDDWKREIDLGLRRCAAVVVALTPRSVDAKKHLWAHYEQTEALRLFAPVIPVKLEDCDLPEHFKEERLQYVDLTSFDDLSFEKLISAIEKKFLRRGRKMVDQTPGTARPFIGREAELREVVDLLRGGDMPVAVSSQITTAVHGMGGIGKTMLAEEILRRLGQRYPGGVIVERRGPMPVTHVQAIFRRWAAYAGHEEKGDLTPAQICGYLKTAGELLVLIDDVWPSDVKTVSQLLAALPDESDRIITTRFTAVAIGLGARPYEVLHLSEEDGIALLKDRLQHKKGPMPPEDDLRRLVEALEGHALALELAAGRIVDTAYFSDEVDELIERIYRRGDLSEEALDLPEPDREHSLVVSLRLSVEALHKTDNLKGTNLAERFAMLGVFAPQAPFDMDGAGAVWKEENTAAIRKTLNTLVGYNLLGVEEGRFKQHMLLHAYARGLLQVDRNKYVHAQILHRDHYLKKARAAKEDWREVDRQFANIAHAAEQVCTLLSDNMVSALGEAEPLDELPDIEKEVARTALAMAEATRDYVYGRMLDAGQRWLRTGLAAARLLKSTNDEIRFLNALGQWHEQHGETKPAVEFFEQALTISRNKGFPSGMALSLNNLGLLYQGIGQPERSIECLEQAQVAYKEAEARDVVKAIRKGIIRTETDIGPQQPKKSESSESSAILLNTGMAHYWAGRLEQALDCFNQALTIDKEKGDLGGQASALSNIGVVYRTTGRPELALQYLEQALSIMRQKGYDIKYTSTLSSIAAVYKETGELERALEYLEQARETNQKIGAVKMVVADMYDIAVVLHSMGRLTEAINMLEKAIDLMERENLHISGSGVSIDDYRYWLSKLRDERQDML